MNIDIAYIKEQGKKIKDGIQKLPDATNIKQDVEDFIKGVIHGEKWDKDQFLDMPKQEKRKYEALFTTAINVLGDNHKDLFLK